MYFTQVASKSLPISSDIVELVAREFAPLIKNIWQGEDIGEYLKATSTQRHTWHAVLSSQQLSSIPDREQLLRSKFKDIIQNVYGTCPPGMVGLLGKLGPFAASAEFYRSAYSILDRDDELAKAVRHLQKIDTNLVQKLATLPNDPLTQQIAVYTLKGGRETYDVEELVWLCNRIGDGDALGLDFNGMSKAVNLTSLIRRRIAEREFPPAPWSTLATLPIVSPKALKDVAVKFGNCIAKFDQFYSTSLDVQSGTTYYFQTNSSDPLLLRFNKFGTVGWFLAECWGLRNRPPTKAEVNLIVDVHAHLKHVRCCQISYEFR